MFYIEGSYACLEIQLSLTRSFGYYALQVYMPSLLTCLLSFVSFMIDHKAVPARISLGLLTVLTVTTQTSGMNSSANEKISIAISERSLFELTIFFAFVRHPIATSTRELSQGH
jgi:hypothetical protein